MSFQFPKDHCQLSLEVLQHLNLLHEAYLQFCEFRYRQELQDSLIYICGNYFSLPRLYQDRFHQGCASFWMAVWKFQELYLHGLRFQKNHLVSYGQQYRRSDLYIHRGNHRSPDHFSLHLNLLLHHAWQHSMPDSRRHWLKFQFLTWIYLPSGFIFVFKPSNIS